MSKLRNIMRIFKNNSMPLEKFSEGARFFLKPQISYIKKKYGNEFSENNKFSVIGIRSIMYSLAIAEELSNHRIHHLDRIPCLLYIFGEEYRSLFTYLFNILRNDQQIVSIEIEDIRNIAIDDVNKGMLNCEHYLFLEADAMSHCSDLELLYKDVIDYNKKNPQ